MTPAPPVAIPDMPTGINIPAVDPPQTQGAQPEHPVNGWLSYRASLPEGLPDNAIDALRDKYFNEHVAPQVLQAGYGLEPARQEFMKRTEREGKSSIPRTNVLLKAALASAVALLPQGPMDAEQMSHDAQVEAAKQGIDPRPYEVVGEMLGQAPYWMMGMGAAGEVGAAINVAKAVQRVINVSAGALIQGGYDAAKAPSGQKAIRGMEGAAAGGLMVGAFEGAGSFISKLLEKGASPEEAAAVQKVAIGMASDKEQALAAEAVKSVPDLKEVIQQGVQEQVKSTEAVGTPDVSSVDLMSKRIKVQVRGADGKPYSLGGAVGMRLNDFQKIVDRIGEHLDNGGAVTAVGGDARVVNQFYGMVEEVKAKNGAFDLKLPARNSEGLPTESKNDETIAALKGYQKAAKDKSEELTDESTDTESEDSTDKLMLEMKQKYRISSSNIKSMGYDSDLQRLEVGFHSGHVYSYDNVPQGIYEKLRNYGEDQASAGQYFHDEIRSNPESYPFTKLKSPNLKHELMGPVSTEPAPTDESLEGAAPGGPAGGDVSYKETPLVHRLSGDIPLLQESGAKGGTITPFAGEKPTVMLGPEADRQTLFHENLHGHIGYLGVREDFHDALWDDGAVTKDLANHLMKDYGYMSDPGDLAEEAFTHATSAVRVGDTAKIQELADANSGEADLLRWVTDTSNNLLDLAAQKGDSLHKRTLERRMGAVINRASGQLEDIRNTFRQSGVDISYDKGAFKLNDAGVIHSFPSRSDALTYLETNHVQGLNVPELVDDGLLSDNVPRFDRGLSQPTNTIPPNTSNFPALDEMAAEPKPQGFLLASRYIRPFYDWLSTAAEKQGRQDLWDAFKPIDAQVVSMDNFIRPYAKVLKDTIGKYSKARQSDFFTLFSAAPEDRADVINEFKFSPQEVSHMADFKEQFMDPLHSDLGHDLNDYLRVTLPKLKGGGIDSAFPRFPMLKEFEGQIPHDKSPFQEAIEMGELSPGDTNLSSIAANYLRAGARKVFLNETLNNAAKLVNETNEDGSYKLGLLHQPLARHIEYMRGVPDHSQKVVYSIMSEAIGKINSGLQAVNAKLPANMQIPSISAAPGDVLQKMVLFNYAGQLALRPAILARDVAQYMLTTFPVLGNYSMTGLQKMYPIFKDLKRGTWESEDIYRIPQQYGALIEKSDLQSLGPEGTLLGAAGKWTNKAMSFIQVAHNSNRIAAFWGHEAMAKDALESFLRHGETERLARESGLWFANQGTRNQYLKEAQLLTRGSDLDDISRRIAKEMVETTQWNFKKGANAGIYEYQIGRLFGQYGTWPLNYIEYARRFVQASDKREAAKALTRLVLTHGAVQAAGASAGIDLSSWVFTQPMAYGGGPALQVLTNIPKSLDFESRSGEDARSEIRRAFWPGVLPSFVPGSHAVDQILKGVNSDDHSEFWLRLMGFQPLEGKAALRSQNHLGVN